MPWYEIVQLILLILIMLAMLPRSRP